MSKSISLILLNLRSAQLCKYSRARSIYFQVYLPGLSIGRQLCWLFVYIFTCPIVHYLTFFRWDFLGQYIQRYIEIPLRLFFITSKIMLLTLTSFLSHYFIEEKNYNEIRHRITVVLCRIFSLQQLTVTTAYFKRMPFIMTKGKWMTIAAATIKE